MDVNTRIKIEVQKLIHGGKRISVFELAERVNKSYSYLCRIASLNEELPTPIEVVLPAMKIKKNYELLKLLAYECGFALVKLPKANKSKKDETEIAAGYQKATTEALQAVLNFFENPSEANYQKAANSLMNATSEGIAVKKYCDKKNSKQLELDL